MIWRWCTYKNSKYAKWVATSKQTNKQNKKIAPPKMYNTAKPHCYKILQNPVIDKSQTGSTHLPSSKHTQRAAMLGKRQTDCKEHKMLKTQIQLLGTVKNPHKLPRFHMGSFLCFYWMLDTTTESQVQSMTVFMFLFPTQMLQWVTVLLCITQMPRNCLFPQKSNLKNPNTKILRQTAQSLTRAEICRTTANKTDHWGSSLLSSVLPFFPSLAKREDCCGLSLFLQSSSIAEGGCLLASHSTKP